MTTQTSTEKWASVRGYEGLYEVSSFGRVRGVDRFVKHSGGRSRVQRGRVLKPHQCGPRAKFGDGYLFVALCVNSTVSQFYVHRLVATAFVPPFTGEEVNHKDLDKHNNDASNLEWTSRGENIAHAIRHGRYVCPHIHGRTLAVNNPNRAVKLTPEDADEIRRLCAAGVRQSDVGKIFGICQATVSEIHRGTIWASAPRISTAALAAYRKEPPRHEQTEAEAA